MTFNKKDIYILENNKQKTDPELEKCEDISTECYGARHTLALMGFLGIVSLFTMRVDLSVTILAMTDYVPHMDNDSVADGCPVPVDHNRSVEISNHHGEFHWDEEIQGQVLASFFYGYILTNILGGRAAEYFGGRVVTGLGVILSGLCTLACPVAATYSSWGLMGMRFLQGICDGITLPALSFLIAKWYPSSVRSKFMAFIMSGGQFGTVIVTVLSGYLCESDFLGGWPSVFYIFGMLGIVWGIVWLQLIADEPTEHPRISDSELKYIVNGVPPKEARTAVPWLSMSKSKYVWVICIAHFGFNWGLFMMLTELPTYLDRIMHFNIKSNGVLSALPYLGMWFFGNVWCIMTDRLIARGFMTILTLRRLSMAVCVFGAALSLIAITLLGCAPTLVVGAIVLTMSFSGCGMGGFLSSHADLTPRYAGTLFGLSNTIAAIPGFLAPAVVGYMTQDNQTLVAWRNIFLMTAAIYAITGSIYIKVITTERQPWNEPKQSSKNSSSEEAGKL